MPPEDVLYRRRHAPERKPEREREHDPYWASDDLPSNARLPDSDLLKAVHAYAADFYHRTTTDRGTISTRSLNETALLAMGILLEESMRQALRETGDLALVESEPFTPLPEDAPEADALRSSLTPLPAETRQESPHESRDGFERPRAGKRRRFERAESS